MKYDADELLLMMFDGDLGGDPAPKLELTDLQVDLDKVAWNATRLRI